MLTVIYDSRWTGSHGIGRFSAEIRNRLSNYYKVNDYTSHYSPVSILGNIILNKDFLYTSSIYSNHLFFSPSFTPPIFSKISFAFTIHDLIHVKYPRSKNLSKFLYYNTVVRLGIKNALHIFTVSEFSRREIIEYFTVDSNKITVIGNGISTCFNEKASKLIYKKPYFLYVGNSKPHKNIIGVLKAFKQFRSKYHFSLVCVAYLTPELKKYININNLGDDVNFIHGISDQELASMYRGAVALLFPSFYEGFGLPVVEAMACGTPVITSNITSLPEIAGDAALLVDPHSLDEIISAMNRIVEDQSLRCQMIDKGLKQSRKFSWDITVKKIVDVIDSITI
ncbi:glycosyltransferase family 4 protein [Thermosynechococcus sichuanensis E542]|uniref:Glycosyltransferase family 4 protein n=1 Tax=Thermosynechococcus sichuanensis E542 TaxID=2016101 RepID=A0A3B7MFA8_9CYAN|nr:glycosyltransferase family 1 protein [Thermosynechococcus vestitus]AXY68084.1 glycosyltransferase family 4 protein [Thermosynechococcus vestitus E542]